MLMRLILELVLRGQSRTDQLVLPSKHAKSIWVGISHKQVYGMLKSGSMITVVT
jgi:hypothetical protein